MRTEITNKIPTEPCRFVLVWRWNDKLWSDTCRINSSGVCQRLVDMDLDSWNEVLYGDLESKGLLHIIVDYDE